MVEGNNVYDDTTASRLIFYFWMSGETPRGHSPKGRLFGTHFGPGSIRDLIFVPNFHLFKSPTVLDGYSNLDKTKVFIVHGQKDTYGLYRSKRHICTNRNLMCSNGFMYVHINLASNIKLFKHSYLLKFSTTT